MRTRPEHFELLSDPDLGQAWGYRYRYMDIKIINYTCIDVQMYRCIDVQIDTGRDIDIDTDTNIDIKPAQLEAIGKDKDKDIDMDVHVDIDGHIDIV